MADTQQHDEQGRRNRPLPYLDWIEAVRAPLPSVQHIRPHGHSYGHGSQDQGPFPSVDNARRILEDRR